MSFFFQELVNGLTTGALYALVALGFSMVYGVLKLLNFAHGDLYMVGAYIGFFVIQWFGGPQHLDHRGAAAAGDHVRAGGGLVGGLGVAIERFAYRPLRDAPRIAPLITAIGVSFFLENSALLLFGAQSAIYNTPDFISFSSGIQIGVGQHRHRADPGPGARLVLMAGLQLLVNRTKLGRQMRAVAADREAAEMLGINVNFVDHGDVLPRLGAGGRRRGHGRAAVQPGRRARSGSSPGSRRSPRPSSAGSARYRARCSAAC